MKRKLLYSIILISIFLMSSVSMVTPVQGYAPPEIPKEAKGATIDDQEVIIYDEDKMEDCIGKGFDIKDIKEGDADIVGARSKYKITEWEADEEIVDFEADYVYGAVDFEESAETIRNTLTDLAGVTATGVPPIIDIIRTFSNLVPGIEVGIVATANGSDDLAAAAISSWEVLMGIYAESYDGQELEREYWNYLDPAEEFDEKPDEKKAMVPWMNDPRDWVNSFYNLRALGYYITGTCDAILTQLDNWYGQLALNAVNNTALHGAMATPGNLPAVLRWSLANISINYGLGTNYTFGAYILASYIVNSVKYNTANGIPSKFGYLVQLLESGLPCAEPAAPFIKKVIDEFNIKEDHTYKFPYGAYGDDWLGTMGAPGADDSISAVPYGFAATTGLGIPIPMGGETIYIYGECEVSVDDAGTVTVEFMYLDDQYDPKDVIEQIMDPDPDYDPGELDDWEWVFPKASDAATIMKDGDEIFYQTQPMEGPIPGYEIPVLIGVSLLSVIGLIYVVMKKRKR